MAHCGACLYTVRWSFFIANLEMAPVTHFLSTPHTRALLPIRYRQPQLLQYLFGNTSLLPFHEGCDIVYEDLQLQKADTPSPLRFRHLATQCEGAGSSISTQGGWPCLDAHFKLHVPWCSKYTWEKWSRPGPHWKSNTRECFGPNQTPA